MRKIRTRKRHVILASLTTLTVSILMMFGVSEASAHSYEFQQGYDVGWVTHGYPDPGYCCAWEHREVIINDHECDGHRTYMQYQRTGSSDYFELYDENGCAAGSNSWNYNEHGGAKILKARICEESVGCKGWVGIYDVIHV